jgi:hypothetical protein
MVKQAHGFVHWRAFVNNSELITLPNVLGGNVLRVEQLHTALSRVPTAKQYILDAKRINFIRPYGVVTLFLATRQLAAQSEHPIQLKNISPEVHSYLQRMDFFSASQTWLKASDALEDSWLRSQYTPNLLEITVISNSEDVMNAVSRSSRIFSRWLKINDLSGLLSVISELCANVYEHSQDKLGCVLIQKYESEKYGQVGVHLSVGDIGQGIRGSLATKHIGYKLRVWLACQGQNRPFLNRFWATPELPVNQLPSQVAVYGWCHRQFEHYTTKYGDPAAPKAILAETR